MSVVRHVSRASLGVSMKSLSRCTLHSFALGAACSAVVLAPALYLYLRRAASIQRFNVDARFTDVCAYDGLVFMSGQVASRGDSIEEQTEAVLADIDAALALAGSHKSRILECTIWLASMDDYAGMNSVYDKWVVPESAPVPVKPKQVSELIRAIREDLTLILTAAKLPPTCIVIINLIETSESCVATTTPIRHDGVGITVSGSRDELVAGFYWTLHKLGFLFPNPHTQISPSLEHIISRAGFTFPFVPRFPKRGFHLHTQHPNEWVVGFLEGDTKVANAFVRWNARNFQTVFEVVVLRSVGDVELAQRLRAPFELAHRLGMYVGISASLHMQQQKSRHLCKPLPLTDKILPAIDLKRKLNEIRVSVEDYIERFPIAFDFISVDMGTTEFSSPAFDVELALMEEARVRLAKHSRELFVKVHASVGQTDPKYGDLNFNFLPKLAHPSIGVLPHTLCFYGLTDASAPIYGRKDFSDMLEFMKQENDKRPTWYYPETSYWVGLDIDVPLLLTDFLLSRSKDMDVAAEMGVAGHLTFTSGHGNGYWLFDWTVALMSVQEYAGQPLAGLGLLKEDLVKWGEEMAFQTRFMKDRGALLMLSSATPLDELPPPLQTKLVSRNTFGELSKDASLLEGELRVLQQMESEMLSADFVLTPELRGVLEVTHLRVQHAVFVRQALLCSVKYDDSQSRDITLKEAGVVRRSAELIMDEVLKGFVKNYPEVLVARSYDNPTSYDFGYLWTTKALHFWEREECMVRDEVYSPLFMNIYNAFSIGL